MSEEVYSSNGEEFYDLDTVMDGLRDNYDIDQEVHIFKGDSIKAKHSDFISGEDVIETMMNNAYDTHGEWAEDYLNSFPMEKCHELGKLIAKFVEDNAEPISFYQVFNIRAHTRKVEE